MVTRENCTVILQYKNDTTSARSLHSKREIDRIDDLPAYVGNRCSYLFFLIFTHLISRDLYRPAELNRSKHPY